MNEKRDPLADPQPGDRWHEMYSYWIHVIDRCGNMIWTRDYVGPCETTPEAACRSDLWKSVKAFQEHVKYTLYRDNQASVRDPVFSNPEESRQLQAERAKE